MDVDVLQQLGKSKAIDVLRSVVEAGEGGVHFTDIRSETNLNANMVNQRIKDLRHTDLIEKGPNRTSPYRATARGEKVLEIAEELESL